MAACSPRAMGMSSTSMPEPSIRPAILSMVAGATVEATAITEPGRGDAVSPRGLDRLDADIVAARLEPGGGEVAGEFARPSCRGR